ncbi:MAG: hypothetical protein JWP87_2943 [Labilithrix sp.]|nr:hypothetical protein [Labilithrix sp.]
MRALVLARAAVRIAVALVPFVACAKDPAPTALTIWAFEERSGTDGADVPLAGAQVAFDPPGGGARMLGTIAPDGHATFEADFTAGGGMVSVFDADHVLVSVYAPSPDAARERPNRIGKPASDVVMFAPRLDDAVRRATVELHGALVSKHDLTSSIDLSASGVPQLGATETTDPSYVLRAPRGRPFFLIGHESHNVTLAAQNIENELLGSFRVDMPALDADTTHDVDIAKATKLGTHLVHTRAEFPKSVTSAFGTGTSGFGTVVSADSGILLAPIKSSRPSSDGHAFDLEMSVAETDVAPERPLTRVSLVAADGSRSVRLEPGIAADGTTWSDFLAPPFVAASATPTALTDPIVVDDFPAGGELVMNVYAGTQLAWIIEGSARALDGPIVLPVPLEVRLPALVAVSFVARADRVDLPPRGEVYRRVSTSHDVLFRR